MQKVVLFTLLATLAFTFPASAERYHYNLESGLPDTGISNPLFPAPDSSYSWQSDHLIASPQCPANRCYRHLSERVSAVTGRYPDSLTDHQWALRATLCCPG